METKTYTINISGQTFYGRFSKVFKGVFLILIIHSTVQAQQTDNRFKDVRLERKGETLEITFQFPIHSKSVGRMESALFIPQLQKGDTIFSLPYIRLNGKDRCKALRRNKSFSSNITEDLNQLYAEENILASSYQKVIAYHVNIPFNSWMASAQLIIKEEIYGCAGAKKIQASLVNPSLEIASGKPSNYVSRTMTSRVRPLVSYITPEKHQEKVRSESGSAYLDFPQAKAIILPNYRNNRTELDRIHTTIDKTRKDPDLEVTAISITGYASPEGNYNYNEQLSWDRAQALLTYLQNNSGLPAGIFDVYPGGEDWNTFRNLVVESYLSNKDKVLSIIDSHEDPDEKERKLQSLGITYESLLKDIYPALRRVDYKIDYKVKNFTAQESRSMLTRNPNHLSPYELYQIAGKYKKETDKWNEILELTVRLHPENDAANINAAGVLLNRGEFVAARIFLEKVRDIPAAWNNWGVYYLYQGDYLQATEYFTKALIMGVKEAIYNLDIRREMELYLEE